MNKIVSWAKLIVYMDGFLKVDATLRRVCYNCCVLLQARPAPSPPAALTETEEEEEEEPENHREEGEEVDQNIESEHPALPAVVGGGGDVVLDDAAERESSSEEEEDPGAQVVNVPTQDSDEDSDATTLILGQSKGEKHDTDTPERPNKWDDEKFTTPSGDLPRDPELVEMCMALMQYLSGHQPESMEQLGWSSNEQCQKFLWFNFF